MRQLKNQFTKAELERYGRLLKDSVRDELYGRDLYATGKLYDSIRDTFYETKNTMSVEISGLGYFNQVDKGRPRNRFVSVSKIKEWLLAKNITSELYPSHSIDEFAAVISKTIKERGTIKRFKYKGANVVDNVMEEHTENFFNDILIAIADDKKKTVAEFTSQYNIIKIQK